MPLEEGQGEKGDEIRPHHLRVFRYQQKVVEKTAG